MRVLVLRLEHLVHCVKLHRTAAAGSFLIGKAVSARSRRFDPDLIRGSLDNLFSSLEPKLVLPTKRRMHSSLLQIRRMNILKFRRRFSRQSNRGAAFRCCNTCTVMRSNRGCAISFPSLGIRRPTSDSRADQIEGDTSLGVECVCSTGRVDCIGDSRTLLLSISLAIDHDLVDGVDRELPGCFSAKAGGKLT
ncbi:hypothetical protein ARMGADRAFT_563431 [Armillaria gallica]|uniref:Uncharacterized protein n=1 Tax=Armillaria gallica TaxID=47427 RepID=A0A2H3CQQ6_ARMGA|nr:hypothetical protein ARMGADRAFT_563431 [Armillaria gallica]